MNSSERILGFEAEADPDGKMIPLVVRMKLDLAELRIRQSDWQALSGEQRDFLVQLPVDNSSEICIFGQAIQSMLSAVGRGSAARSSKASTAIHFWLEDTEPQSVAAVRLRAGVEAKWETLDRFGRYVLSYAARKNDITLCRIIAADMPTMMRIERVQNS